MPYQNQDQDDKNSCPFCGSPDWKMASLVYAEGISTIAGNTSSSGVGVGTGGFGVGVSKGKYEGQTQSETSLRASPPEPPLMNYAILISIPLAIITFIIFYIKSNLLMAAIMTGISYIVIIIISIFLSYLYINHFSDIQYEYNKSLEKWAKVKMCLRCGLFFDK